MSSTTFGPVFSGGASGHPVEPLDPRAEGAGGAQQLGEPCCGERPVRIDEIVGGGWAASGEQ